MNETNAEHERIERLLKKAHLPQPSSQLHDRVATAAGQAWDQEPTDVPWQIPLRRLALSAAAACLVASAANHLSDRVTSRARSYAAPASSVAQVRDASDDSFGAWVEDLPYRYRLGSIRPYRRLIDSQVVRDRMETLNRMLDAMNHNGI